ncbi:MAG: hypothetical protein PHS73_04325 [Candidatus Peribacteraceae bacterium]|nr:hypothetical protein [Candidatus Peribacteraceae bacterium]
MENCREVAENLVIREAENPDSLLSQDFRPFTVVFLLFCVDAAINLDDKAPFNAEKISNKPFERYLSSEFEPRALSVSEGIPEDCLCQCHFFAQFSGIDDFPFTLPSCGRSHLHKGMKNSLMTVGGQDFPLSMGAGGMGWRGGLRG